MLFRDNLGWLQDGLGSRIAQNLIIMNDKQKELLLHWAKQLSYEKLSEHKLYQEGEWLMEQMDKIKETK